MRMIAAIGMMLTAPHRSGIKDISTEELLKALEIMEARDMKTTTQGNTITILQTPDDGTMTPLKETAEVMKVTGLEDMKTLVQTSTKKLLEVEMTYRKSPAETGRQAEASAINPVMQELVLEIEAVMRMITRQAMEPTREVILQ